MVRSVDINLSSQKPKKVPPKKALSWDQDDFKFVDEDDDPFRPKPLPKNKKVEDKVDKHGLKVPQYRSGKAGGKNAVAKESQDSTRKYVSKLYKYLCKVTSFVHVLTFFTRTYYFLLF